VPRAAFNEVNRSGREQVMSPDLGTLVELKPELAGYCH
jgi:hypothetical protein